MESRCDLLADPCSERVPSSFMKGDQIRRIKNSGFMSAQESISTFRHGYPFMEHLEVVVAGYTKSIELRMLQKSVICKRCEQRKR